MGKLDQKIETNVEFRYRIFCESLASNKLICLSSIQAFILR